MEAAQKKVDEVRAEIAQLEEERDRIDRNDPPIKVRPDSEQPKELRGINIGRRLKLSERATPGGALASQRRQENQSMLAHQQKQLDKANAELEKARAKHEKAVAVLKTAQAGLDAATAGAARSLTLRARNGAALVAETGDVRAAVEGAGTDGPDLRRALKFRMAIPAGIGVPATRRPLTQF